MRLIFRQIRGFLTIIGVLALAGCSRMSEVGFDTKMALGSVSMIDRCSDFMRRAFPDNTIDIGDSHVTTGAESALVTVQGVRTGVPENSNFVRAVAVECHFEGGVLTSFHWIAGPIRPVTTGQAP